VELTEEQKMLAGELYRADDPELVLARRRCRDLLRRIDAEPEDEARAELFRELLGAFGDSSFIQPPFRCDYGSYIRVGERVFVNFDCTILDCGPVTIGDGVQIASGVQLLAADHPREPELRADGLELGRPVVIEDNVWLGAGAIVCPGVRIGRDSIVGAGSVVTRDVPPGVVAAGNPCRVIREL
jgi:maltose O-acetyltransferase